MNKILTSKKEIETEIKKVIFNYADLVPRAMRPLIYAMVNDLVSEYVIEGARVSSRTITLCFITALFIILYPEGDIVITRDDEKGHNKGLKPRLIKLFTDSAVADAFPFLKTFKVDNDNNWIYWIHKNGHIQKIWFIGEKMGGIQKNKSVTPDGYFSLVIKDEAEENAEKVGETSEVAKQLTEDKKRTFRRRDQEKYKDIKLYPRTKFIYAYNPKSPNGEFEDLFVKFMKPDIKVLETKGYQIKIIPNYKNGSGLFLMRTNMILLLNDEKRFWPQQEDINEMKWMRENEPEIYKMDYLGIRWERQDTFFNHYKNILRDKIDVQYIPIALGIDQGLIDNTTFILNASEYILNNGKIELTQKNGSVFEKIINGKKGMSLKQKKEHIIFGAREVVNFVINNIFIKNEWIKWYKDNSFYIAAGSKDHWLLSEIEEILDNEYPQFSNFINIFEITDVVYNYNIEKRILLEQNANKRRTNILTEKLTPELFKFYNQYGYANYRNNDWRGLDVIDAYFYSKYRYFNEVQRIKKYYEFYQK